MDDRELPAVQEGWEDLKLLHKEVQCLVQESTRSMEEGAVVMRSDHTRAHSAMAQAASSLRQFNRMLAIPPPAMEISLEEEDEEVEVIAVR